MSYDIELLDPVTKEVIELETPHQFKGGTYQVGGSNLAELNITYNYSTFYYKYICEKNGIRSLYGKTGKECISIISTAIQNLGSEPDEDYWNATPGNAGKALQDLLTLIQKHPNCIVNGN